MEAPEGGLKVTENTTAVLMDMIAPECALRSVEASVVDVDG